MADVAASKFGHSFAVLSRDPVKICVPSGENPTDQTSLPWPEKVRISKPVCTFHNFAVKSCDPVKICVPSGENATEVTHPK